MSSLEPLCRVDFRGVQKIYFGRGPNFKVSGAGAGAPPPRLHMYMLTLLLVHIIIPQKSGGEIWTWPHRPAGCLPSVLEPLPTALLE
jgi:hypothetical protein